MMHFDIREKNFVRKIILQFLLLMNIQEEEEFLTAGSGKF